jgi:hypothetical protein
VPKLFPPLVLCELKDNDTPYDDDDHHHHHHHHHHGDAGDRVLQDVRILEG